MGVCERVGIVHRGDLYPWDFSWCCSAASFSLARSTRRKSLLLANRNRNLPSKQLRLQNKRPQSRQHPSRNGLNRNRAAKGLHLRNLRLKKCERQEPLPLSDWAIRAHHKREDLADQSLRLLRRLARQFRKLRGRNGRKLVLNRRARRIGQVRSLPSQCPVAPCGQR
jgi:hypothetical protein